MRLSTRSFDTAQMTTLFNTVKTFATLFLRSAVSTKVTKLIDNYFLILDLKVSNRLLQRSFAVPAEAIVFPALSFHIFLAIKEIPGQYLKVISRRRQCS